MGNEVEITVSGNNNTGGMFRGVDGSFRDLEGKLRDARGRFKRETDGMASDAGQSFSGVGSRISSSILGGMGGLGANLAKTIGMAGSAAGPEAAAVGAGIGAALAAPILAAMIPVVNSIGGLLASLPALVVGGGAGIGTLALGFMGLSDAFKETASTGARVADNTDRIDAANKRVASSMRGVASAARGVTAAEREVRNAQEEALKAQEDITKARETAAKRYAELNRQLANTKLDKESAALDVTQTKENLRVIGIKGPTRVSANDKAEAELAYRKALQRYDDVSAALDDLTAEQAEANQEGIEGSDEVQTAYDRQQKAAERLIEAQERLVVAQENLTVAQQDLADAQEGVTKAHEKQAAAAGGAAAAAMKLAPAAQEVVNVIKSLRPAFEDLRLDVQQRLFSGVGTELEKLAHAWLPQAKKSLGDFADTFNGIFKTFSDTAQQPEFITNIGKGIESVREQVDKIGNAIAGPFTEAWGRLSGAAKPILDLLGDKISGLIIKFAEWIEEADKSGKLQEFMEGAADSLEKIWDTGEDVVSIIGDLWDAFSNTQTAGDSLSLLDRLREGIHQLAVWLDDPKNKQNITDLIDLSLTFTGNLIGLGLWCYNTGKKLDELWDKFTDGKGALDWVSEKLDNVVGYFSGLGPRIRNAASGMWDGIKDSFRDMMNWIIWKWNNLSFNIGGGSFMGMDFPGASFNTPNVPYLAHGGIKGGLAMVGERGRELVRLPQGATTYSAEDTARMTDGSNGSTQVELYWKNTGDPLMDTILEQIGYRIRTDRATANMFGV